MSIPQSFLRIGLVCVASLLPGQASASGTNVQALTLAECIELALLNNRDLQAERITPNIARDQLGVAYGYYDPIFLGDVRRERDVRPI